MRIFFPSALAILMLSSCSKTPAGGQHATVELRDGTSVPGTVISTSGSEVQVAGDDKVTRTIPMNQVRAIEYDGTGPAEAPSALTATKPEPPPTRTTGQAELRHREHRHPEEAAITARTHELPPGTEISVRNEETIDSSKAAEGQTFPAEVTNDVLDGDGNVVIPAGANAQIVIRSASKGGKIRGASDLVLDLATVAINGRQYEVTTADLTEKGHSGIGANRRTGEFMGGGAALGGIIGAIAGGGKGAAIGAGSGAAAGAVTEVLTKGKIKVPVESVLKFKLDEPLRVNTRA
jgi:hypothetical protein